MKRIFALVLVFLMAAVPAGLADDPDPIVRVELTEDVRAAAGLFLSNFTEIGLDSVSVNSPDEVLVDFAHDHMWFNSYESYEYGDYARGNNCRVSDDRIQDIIERYFYDFTWEVDLSQTRFDYEDGYYYHCETGGWTSCGFAVVTDIWQVQPDTYFISFMVFGGGYDWDNSVMGMTVEQAQAEYFYADGYGSALVHAEDIGDRSTYKLISYGAV